MPELELPSDIVELRKLEHQILIATHDVSGTTEPGWDDIHLLHEALPDVDLDGIDISVELLGRSLNAPLVIAALTGGHPDAYKVNAALASAAERHGLAMGVGSQRAAIRNPDLAYTYSVVREVAPTSFVIGNIGVAQLIEQEKEPPLSPEDLNRAVAMIDADAMAVHLNFLEECVQPEGDRNAKGSEAAISSVVKSLKVPVIVKETGAGISRDTAFRIKDLGAAAIDVGGAGGTSYAVIEGLRAKAQGDERGQRLGELMRGWGISTAVSIMAAVPTGLPIVATGGIRNGLHAAKALAMGASLVGVSVGLLRAALAGEKVVEEWISQLLYELRCVMFLTGCESIADLQTRPRVVVGATKAWIEQLGYESVACQGE